MADVPFVRLLPRSIVDGTSVQAYLRRCGMGWDSGCRRHPHIPSISVSLHWATIRAKGHVIVDGMGGIEWGRVWGVGSFGSGFSTF